MACVNDQGLKVRLVCVLGEGAGLLLGIGSVGSCTEAHDIRGLTFHNRFGQHGGNEYRDYFSFCAFCVLPKY